MSRNPYADRALPRLQHAAGHLPGRRQDERVLPWGGRLDRPEHAVVQVDEPAQLGKVAADQGEVVMIVQPADRVDPFQTRPVAELAAEREAGVRRVGDQTVAAYQVHRGGNGPGL